MLSICFVTPDLLGPIRNGGVGTATSHLAGLAEELGHDVTVLFTIDQQWLKEDLSFWQRVYDTLDIELVLLERVSGELGRLPFWPNTDNVKTAFLVAEYLKTRHFDVVLFPDWRGFLYFCGTSKQQGLAFRDTTLGILAHSTQLWSLEGSDSAIESLQDLTTIWLERRSMASADLLIAFNDDMLDWYRTRKFRLPAEVVKLPFSYRPDNRVAVAMAEAERSKAEFDLDDEPKEADAPGDAQVVVPDRTYNISFFGRLETRKGVSLFCDAVDRLARTEHRRSLKPHKIRFIGKVGSVDGIDAVSYILHRSRHWPFAVELLVNRSHPYVLRMLTSSTGIVVIPSQTDNYPLTIVETARLGLCVIGAKVGGIPEMFADEHRSTHVFEPHPKALAEMIDRLAAAGFPAPQLEHTEAEAHHSWVDLFEKLEADRKLRPPSLLEAQSAGGPPSLTVILLHRNRHKLLRQALTGLRRQDRTGFELIVVDDGSDDPATVKALPRLEEEIGQLGGRLIRCDDVWLGAARWAAARQATTDYLLFMDDDNVAMPGMVSSLMSAAGRTDADIVLCGALHFEGDEYPWDRSRATSVFVPLGSAAPITALINNYGDTNFLVKRSVFNALGGFIDDFMVGSEDWEFLVRADAAGYTISPLATPLYFKRNHPSSVATRVRQRPSLVRPMLSARSLISDDSAYDAISFLHGLYHQGYYQRHTDEWYRKHAGPELSLLASKFSRFRAAGNVDYTAPEVALASYLHGQFGGCNAASTFIGGQLDLDTSGAAELDWVAGRLARGLEAAAGEDRVLRNPLARCANKLLNIVADPGDRRKVSWSDVTSGALAEGNAAELPTWLSAMAAISAFARGETVAALVIAAQAAQHIDSLYLVLHADLAAAVRSGWVSSGLEHYFLAGREEGRQLIGNPGVFSRLPVSARRQIATLFDNANAARLSREHFPRVRDQLFTAYVLGLPEQIIAGNDVSILWGCGLICEALQNATARAMGDGDADRYAAMADRWTGVSRSAHGCDRALKALHDTVLAPDFWVQIGADKLFSRTGWSGPRWVQALDLAQQGHA